MFELCSNFQNLEQSLKSMPLIIPGTTHRKKEREKIEKLFVKDFRPSCALNEEVWDSLAFNACDHTIKESIISPRTKFRMH